MTRRALAPGRAGAPPARVRGRSRAPRPRHGRRGTGLPGAAGGVAARARARTRRLARTGRSVQGEALLGIGASSDVLRSLSGLPSRPRRRDSGHDATRRPARGSRRSRRSKRLRASLRSNRDRAAVDVVLGVILADAASSAGQQRKRVLKSALAAFVRAVREDPAERNCEARSRGAPPGDGARGRRAGLAPRAPPTGSPGATRTRATRPHPLARKERGSEPMLPLAEHRLPDAVGRARRPRVHRASGRCSRSASGRARRVRVTLGLRPPVSPRARAPRRAGGPGRARRGHRRAAGRPCHRLDARPLRRRAVPHVRRQPLDAGNGRAGRASCGWSARERSAGPSTPRSPTSPRASRRSRTG